MNYQNSVILLKLGFLKETLLKDQTQNKFWKN
jgi:hypothetical protein